MDDALENLIGTLPQEWRNARLGRLVDEYSGGTPSKEEPRYWQGDIPWVSPKDMKRPVIRDSIDHVSKLAVEEASQTLLEPPAILMVVRGMILAHSVPVAETAAPVTINQDIKALLPRDGVHPRYLAYYLRGLESVILSLVEESGHGTKALRSEQWRSLPVALPPLPTQRAIANFLDEKTEAIDELVAKKERLIELLEEKRAALINQAVTRGLDPDVPMKDSGVPWIGEIPEHWEVVQLRRTVANFVDYRGKPPPKTKSGVPLITAGAIKDGGIDHSLAPQYVSEDTYDEWMVRGFPEIGDVLLTTEAPLGEVARIDDTGVALAQRIIMLKANCRVSTADWLYFFFLSEFGQAELWSRSSGSTAKGIKGERLRHVDVLLPPMDEQERITDHLSGSLDGFFAIVVGIQSQIERIEEYRQSVVTAAVTGKLPHDSGEGLS